jgi:HSP20 family protein
MPKKKASNESGDEDSIFSSFDDELNEMRERMDRIFDAFMRNELGPDRAPLVYGFSVQTGQDGEPVMQEFGNAPAPPKISDRQPVEREPLIDVIESGEIIKVIVELPGVRKDDIKIDAHERLLEIMVDNDSKPFHEQIDLPCDVIKSSVKAGYKNGVLEISMKRIARKKKGRTVQVE